MDRYRHARHPLPRHIRHADQRHSAWYGGIHIAGEVHELAKPVIIFFVRLHTLAALWQHFVAKTDVLMRMLKPTRGSA